MKLTWTKAAICVALAWGAGTMARAAEPDGTRNYIEDNVAFQVITRDGKVTLVAMDPTNKLNFEGPINTAAEMAKVPRAVLAGYRLASVHRQVFADVSPDEWKVLSSRIAPVLQRQGWLAESLDASALPLPGEIVLDADNPLAPSIQKMMTPASPIKDPDLKVLITDYRDALLKLRRDLETARENLKRVVTVKQEFLLIQCGVLE